MEYLSAFNKGRFKLILIEKKDALEEMIFSIINSLLNLKNK